MFENLGNCYRPVLFSTHFEDISLPLVDALHSSLFDVLQLHGTITRFCERSLFTYICGAISFHSQRRSFQVSERLFESLMLGFTVLPIGSTKEREQVRYSESAIGVFSEGVFLLVSQTKEANTPHHFRPLWKWILLRLLSQAESMDVVSGVIIDAALREIEKAFSREIEDDQELRPRFEKLWTLRKEPQTT